MATGSYVEACDLLTGPTLREARVAIPAGELDLERLAAVGDPPPGRGAVPAVRPGAAQRARAAALADRARSTSGSRAPGRLARVGLAARLVDAGLVTSLLLRGRVPGGTAAAASERYDAIRARDPRVVYHGRVVREGRWVVLHYMFFYAMNDWRSTFEGANDHEADLEQCFVVLEALDDGTHASRPGSARRPTTRRATTCAAAGTTRGWRRSTAIRSSTRAPARTRPTSSAASTSCCCRSPASGTSAGRSTSSGGSGATRSPSRTRATWRPSAKRALSVPFVDYARGDGLVGRARRRRRVDADHHRRRRRLGRPLPRPVGPRHRRPVRRRARPGRPEVHPDRLGPPVVARPARVRRPRQGRAAVAGDPGPRGADRGADGRRGPRSTAEAEALAVSLPAARRGGRPPSAATAGLDELPGGARRSSCTTGEERLAQPARRRRSSSARRSPPAATGWPRCGPASSTIRGSISTTPSEPEPPAVTRRRAFGEAWAALSVGLLIAALAVIVWFRILPPPLAIVVLLGSYLAIESFFDRNVVRAGPQDHRRPGDHLGAHPRGRPTCASCSWPGCSRSGSCSSPTTSARSAAASCADRSGVAAVRRCAVMRRNGGAGADRDASDRPGPRPEVTHGHHDRSRLDDQRGDRRALARAHVLLVVGPGRARPDRHRPRRGRLPVHARGRSGSSTSTAS